MNRMRYFNYIEEKLNMLAYRINQKGKLNLLDMHMHSEDFYLHFFNKLYLWQLENLNKESHNAEAIDLIDKKNKIIIQVSATNTKDKIQTSLTKIDIYEYKGYTFKFISISKTAKNLKTNIYTKSNNIIFNPKQDIYDIEMILKYIKQLDIVLLNNIYEFVKLELGLDVDIVKLDSYLSSIIKILAEENMNKIEECITLNSFEINRKIEFNNLFRAKPLIDDYKVYHNRLVKIYEEYDIFGKNQSSLVLGTIRSEYLKATDINNDDDIFFHVIEKIQEKVTKSANYPQITIEELEQCINILVVDSFIRCKIFKNPDNYNYAIT